MTRQREVGPAGPHPYALWDAAYVLGSLSSTDRREFEDHLPGCPRCQEAVAEVAGLPALLSQLDDDTASAILQDDPAASHPPPDLLPSGLTGVRRRPRRSLIVAWAATAAAAALVGIGVLIGVNGFASAPEHQPSAVSMTQVGTTTLASTIAVRSEPWGSHIDLNCVCLAPVNAHHDTLALVVVGRDGRQTQLATWVAEPGHTATPAGSIALSTDQIAAVHVVSADSGAVLLRHTL